MKINKSISVIILTYNSEKYIYNCLDSLYKYNDIGNELEVIIVDNMSDDVDEMFEGIKQRYDASEIVLLKNQANSGYGGGNNVGIKYSSAPVTLIMNPDVLLVSPIFKQAKLFFSKSRNGVLGMIQLYPSMKRAESAIVAFKYIGILNILLQILVDRFNLTRLLPLCPAGACFFIRKSAFEQIDFFDEKLFMYCEERDVYFRLKSQTKYKVAFDKKMRYIHCAENRPLSFCTIKNIYKSRKYLCLKYKLDLFKTIRCEIRTAKFSMLILNLRDKRHKNVPVLKDWLCYLRIELANCKKENNCSGEK